LGKITSAERDDSISLKGTMTDADFPVLSQYGIPRDKFSIPSLLLDVVKLNGALEENILSFSYYNSWNPHSDSKRYII
jgi:hypothetical protein